jgi:hypothetical protein
MTFSITTPRINFSASVAETDQHHCANLLYAGAFVHCSNWLVKCIDIEREKIDCVRFDMCTILEVWVKSHCYYPLISAVFYSYKMEKQQKLRRYIIRSRPTLIKIMPTL